MTLVCACAIARHPRLSVRGAGTGRSRMCWCAGWTSGSPGKSGEVRDDSWTEFVNSFIGQGPDRIVGVSGNATCLCGKVTAERFSAEVQSITALILAVTG